MKIAYVTDQILPRTATDTRQMVSMASALGRTGASVTLVTPRRWFGREPSVQDIAVFYEIEPAFALRSVRSLYPNIRGLEKIAQGIAGPFVRATRDADIVYTRTLPIVLGSLLLGNRPVVYETYRPWPLQRPFSKRFFRRLGNHPRFLGAVLHSNFARDSYGASGVPASKLLTAYNGYARRNLTPVLPRQAARARCSLPADGRIVTYAGRLDRKKGVDLLLDLAGRLTDVTFVLVGSEHDGIVEQTAKRLPNVMIVPWQPESRIAPYLYAADVLIIPPTSRPLQEVGNTVLPIKTFQYLAAGRAILAPNTPDLSELLVDGLNACLVEPDAVEGTAVALRELLEDSERIHRLEEHALETSRRFTWENRAGKVLDFITGRLAELNESIGSSKD
ncbi:MAG: glycosyltransferase family 4 protein [Rhodothermales bacterium]